jgi:alpha-tubulin suppressor-like RCC1 family protein
VISVSAGSSHSLFLSSQGRAYSCGDNIFGQLGLNSNDNQSAPIWIESLRTEEIIDVSAGTIHSLFLTSQGQVYGCGSNKRGQLGTENQIEKKIPTLIESIKSVKVIAISAGRCHSLILDHRGQVFGFGDNENGQLGLGDQANRYLPVLVLRVNKIVAISAGGFHSLVLNDQGQIYSFGSNSSGQLGRRDIDYGSVTPLLIKDSGFGKAVAISAGSHHSLLLNSLGQVFSFGSNVYGQLGLGGDDDIPFPTLIELSIGKISAISAGDSHSLIMNSEGQVLSFGSNEYDQLGLGDEDGTSIPTLIRGFRF